VFGDEEGLASLSTSDSSDSMLAKAQAQIAQRRAIAEAKQGEYVLSI
jgi:hypothetical protein